MVNGTTCADDGNDCTNDLCNAGTCDHPAFGAGTVCGNGTPEGLCDAADTCEAQPKSDGMIKRAPATAGGRASKASQGDDGAQDDRAFAPGE